MNTYMIAVVTLWQNFYSLSHVICGGESAVCVCVREKERDRLVGGLWLAAGTSWEQDEVLKHT